MLTFLRKLILIQTLLICLLPLPVSAENASYSPAVGRAYPINVYWGDTHVHSSWSPDAAAGGNRQLGPDAAYRFARGEAVIAHNGMPVKLSRPLDFLVLADHSEYLGLFPQLEAGNPALLATETGHHWYDMVKSGEAERAKILIEFGYALQSNTDVIKSKEFSRSMWHRVAANADRYNDPGRFTAFIGYEWTSTRDGANLHRNVIFKDGADKTNQVEPFTSFDSPDPEDLWRYMAGYTRLTGGEVLAIPHNSNMSAGQMFASVDFSGKPLSKAYAQTRRRWEPLVEVTQYKGDSETHPSVSPNDEFADYESWDKFAGFSLKPHEEWMFQHEYVRPALRLGLALGSRLGVNPYRFGLVGGTDSHTSLATAEENSFWGKFSWHEPSPTRALEPFVNIKNIVQKEWQMAAEGYTALWAMGNTREALFDAMRRKETYATTGPRMVVRFFGGWRYRQSDTTRPEFVRIGYEEGVPMGGDLPPATPGAQAPVFMVRAIKDPDGANLDRIQIIKGWLSESGETRERVYDVALADGRTLAPGSTKAPPVGNTTDVGKASYSNTIGDPQLIAFWLDPDFDPGYAAFYYVRVIEIPTPRWTAFDAKYFGTKMTPDVPMIIQERAYTSPIWYTPLK